MRKDDVAVQVAFNMFIPCMLFTKVASTLSAQPDISLIAIPALALAQVWHAFNALLKSNHIALQIILSPV